MDWQETIKISKLDAARRQIDTAVRLYFDYGDPVSIHTLAAAAFDILQGLDKQGPNTGTFYNRMAERFQPEHRKVVIDAIRTSQNFFKHANLDPEATLEFNPGEAEILLLGACDKFGDLVGRRTAEMGLYVAWFIMQNPGMISFKGIDRSPEFPAEFKFQPDQRSEFFATFIARTSSLAAGLDGRRAGF